MAEFSVRVTDWQHDEPAIRALREAVFIAEQGIPPAEEWDAHDAQVPWVLAEAEDGTPIGCGRLLPGGRIGRMAVLAAWRGQGVGDAMLRELLVLARERGEPRSVLSAQVHAIPFYARFGYQVTSEEYLDAGIPHRDMELDLGPHTRPAGLSGPGPDTQTQRLRSLRQCQDAVIALATGARRQLSILTRDLDPALYETPEFLAAVRALALRGRVLRVRVLVADTQRAVREGHRLLDLHQAVSSWLHIRLPDPDGEWSGEVYCIADDDGILHRVQDGQYNATFEPGGSALARARLRDFDRQWQRSTTDPNLRRLHV